MPRRPIVVAVLLVPVAAVGLTLRSETPPPENGPRAAAESPAAVRPVGMMVNHPVANEDAAFPELAFLGTFDRTALVCRVTRPAGGIVEVRGEQSRLEEFGDDRGTDLVDPEDTFGPFDAQNRVAEDRRSALVTLGTERLPHPRATRLVARGEVALWVAEEQAVATGEPVALGEGATTTVGPWDLEVTRSGASDWTEGWALTLRTHADPSAIVRWALVDEEGTEHALSQRMTMSGGGQWTLTLEGEQPLERGAVRVEHWVEPELVRVPFDLEVGLGLGR